jgi:hypothetical protein
MIKRSREEWETLFTEQAAGGLSARQFCVERGLCDKHFSMRKKQLQGTPPSSLPAPAPAFVRVQKVNSPKSPSSESARVILRYGHTEIDLHDASPEWLAQLLMALA